MKVNKAVDADLLQKELRAAGVPFRSITAWQTGVTGETDVFDHDEHGAQIDPSAAALPIINAHAVPTEPPAPDFGTDEPDPSFRGQAAQAVQQLRAYIGLASPTAANRLAWERLVSKILLFIIRYIVAPPPPPAPPPPLPLPLQIMGLVAPTEESEQPPPADEQEAPPPPLAAPPDEEVLAAEQEARASVALITLARRAAREQGLDDGSLIEALMWVAEALENSKHEGLIPEGFGLTRGGVLAPLSAEEQEA